MLKGKIATGEKGWVGGKAVASYETRNKNWIT